MWKWFFEKSVSVIASIQRIMVHVFGYSITVNQSKSPLALVSITESFSATYYSQLCLESRIHLLQCRPRQIQNLAFFILLAYPDCSEATASTLGSGATNSERGY